jgi:2'-5' RNA ligase
MRTFLAADIESGVRQKLSDALKRFVDVDRKIKWVKPENIHITINFFGEVDEKTKLTLEKVIEETSKSIQPFSVTIGGMSAFPSMKSPRVFWIGVEDASGTLKKIHKEIDRSLLHYRLKVKREKRDYTPHLTIGRVKVSFDKNILNIIAQYSEHLFGTFQIKDIVLYRSILQPIGPLYESLRVFKIET